MISIPENCFELFFPKYCDPRLYWTLTAHCHRQSARTEQWKVISTDLASGQAAWSHLSKPGGLRDAPYLPQWDPGLPVPSQYAYLPRNLPALWIAWFTAFRLFNSSVWLLQRILYWFIKSLLRSYSSMYRFFMFFLGEQSAQLVESLGTRK